MSIYTPDAWVVVDIATKSYGTNRKVLAGWYGGFAGSNSWKLSSGVTSVNEYSDRYEFINESGSIYVCYKTVQRMTGLMHEMFASWQDQIKDIPGATIIVVDFP